MCTDLGFKNEQNKSCVHAQSCLTLRLHRLRPARVLCPRDLPRREYWSGLSFPPPLHLPDPGIKLPSPAAPALAAFFTAEPLGKHNQQLSLVQILSSSCCHCYLITELCLTFCHPVDWGPPGSSVHWISQARILEWGHFLLWGIFPTQGLNPSLLPGRQIPYHWATWEAPNTSWVYLKIRGRNKGADISSSSIKEKIRKTYTVGLKF